MCVCRVTIGLLSHLRFYDLTVRIGQASLGESSREISTVRILHSGEGNRLDWPKNRCFCDNQNAESRRIILTVLLIVPRIGFCDGPQSCHDLKTADRRNTLTFLKRLEPLLTSSMERSSSVAELSETYRTFAMLKRNFLYSRIT